MVVEPVGTAPGESYAAAVTVAGVAGAVVIGGYAVFQLVWIGGPYAGFVAAVDLVLVAVCAGAAVLARSRRLTSDRQVDATLAAVVAAIALGVLVEALLLPDREARLTAHYLMVLVIAGVVLRSRALLWGYLAVATAVWFAAHALTDRDVWAWSTTFLVACGVALAMHGFVRTVYRTTLGRELAAESRARVDELTDLPNRLGVRDRVRALLAQARREQEPLWCAFLDVDHFKQANDEYGHAEGDALLVAVARSVQAVARGSDAVGRWGGDEFVLVGLGAPPEPEQLRRRIRDELSVRNPLSRHGWDAGVTVGIAVTGVAPDEDAVQAMLVLADEDMYRRRGRR